MWIGVSRIEIGRNKKLQEQVCDNFNDIIEDETHVIKYVHYRAD